MYRTNQCSSLCPPQSTDQSSSLRLPPIQICLCGYLYEHMALGYLKHDLFKYPSLFINKHSKRLRKVIFTKDLSKEVQVGYINIYFAPCPIPAQYALLIVLTTQ